MLWVWVFCSLRHDVASLYHLWHLVNGLSTTETFTPFKTKSARFATLLRQQTFLGAPDSSSQTHIKNSNEINVVWKSDEKLLIFASLISPSKITFVWEVISSIRHSVSSPDETPRSSSKILRCASFIFNPFVSVSSGNETLRNMLDILLQGLLYNRLQVQINQPVYACPVGRRIYPFGTYMAVPPLGPTVQLEI